MGWKVHANSSLLLRQRDELSCPVELIENGGTAEQGHEIAPLIFSAA